jgi:dihydroneopterin aldolase
MVAGAKKPTTDLASPSSKCGISIRACHGAMPPEAEISQHFKIDLDISIDLSESSLTDRLSDTICYGEVVAAATKAFTSVRRRLLERAASDVVHAPFAGFPRISAVRITIHKFNAPAPALIDSSGVSLLVERS